MIRELKDTHNYKKVMLVLSVLTFVSGLAYSVIGEISLPFAAAFCAALFLFEKPKGRFLSYAVPAVTVLLNVLIDGPYGLISTEYILLALIIVLVYKSRGTKSECAIYISVVTALFIALALYLGATKVTGSFNIDSAFGYYSELLVELENEMVNLYSSAHAGNSTVSPEQIDLLFYEIRIQTVSLIAGAAFIITGFAIKLFTIIVLRISKRGILVSFAHFLPTNVTAFAYVIVLILSIFSGTESLFGIIMLNISNILMLVFAYIGIRYVSTLARMTGKKGFIYAILIATFVTIPDVALRILSFLGAWATIGTNNTLNMTDES